MSTFLGFSLKHIPNSNMLKEDLDNSIIIPLKKIIPSVTFVFFCSQIHCKVFIYLRKFMKYKCNF